MITYLENANPAYISVSGWGGSWTATHGETRSASQYTFHIGVRFTNGSYYSCILVTTRQYGPVPVEGTVENWGSQMPSLGQVLRHYQSHYSVTPLHDSTPGPSDNGGDDGGAGGAGAGGSGGSGGWAKEVKPDAYEDEEYHACDGAGNELKTTVKSSSGTYRTSNPRDLVLVYQNSKGETYYRHKSSSGRTEVKPCRLEKDTKGYFFEDSRRKTHGVQFVSRQPDWMGSSSSRSKTSSAQASYGSSYSSSSGKASSYKTSSTSSKPKLMTDPKSGRKYYVGSDGKTHWA
ncbi:hypothetical protein VM1G_04585 [Cytospora mali]|uniref:Uncharacterized protein n=1 Tax=Cytospora mali TaxID=578113 RepID=A0A194VXH0_CYTMA|nr:hypothetical protein VM1G_04585 [Valsa mali]